ncbi:MAG: lamin tail domain-containing protein [Bacteroidota bacterium]
MFIRFLQLWICLSVVNLGLAQVFDDFSDGDFTVDPIWNGDQADFEINSNGELHLSAPIAGVSHMATESTLFDKIVWEFFIRIEFNPSSSNLAKIYLISDQADLEGSLNGYYLMFGDTEDEISLYKQEGLTSTYIINGTDGLLATNQEVRIKVIRDQNGRWTLYQALGGGTNFEYVGTSIDLDPDIIGTNYFGFLCQYTVTRADKFYFDDILVDQLRIDTVEVINDTALAVQFNQYLLDNEISVLSDFNVDGRTISDISFDSEDSTRIILSFDALTPLETGGYQLSLSSALTLNEPESKTFNYTKLELDTVQTISETEVLLDFNQPLNPVSAEDINHYLIDQGIGQPVSAQLIPADPSQVLLTVNEALSDGITYLITYSDIFNDLLNSEVTGSTNFAFIIPLLIDQMQVLSEDSLLVNFNKQIDPVTATIPANYFIDQGIGNPYAVTVGEDQQSVYLVLENTFGESSYQLEINHVKGKDGFEIEAGSSVGFEYIPIKLSFIEQIDFETISLSFNQPVDQASAELINNFQIIGGDHPIAASKSIENDSIIYLTFPDLENSYYQLIIKDVHNEIENSALQDTIDFRFEKPTPYRSIQINEVMADFSPSAGLPEAEYVELYNRGPYPISLKDFLLNGEIIPEFVLESNAYVLLTDDANSGLFEGIPVAYISTFDALTNTGDTVILRDQFGNLLDSISYSTTWYQNPEKDDGGYSLEQVNPNQICSDETNWRASENASGGTPGRANSILNLEEDTSGPRISSFEIVSGDSILIVFGEPVLPGSFTGDNVSMNLNSVDMVEELSYREYLMILDSQLISEVSHHLRVENVGDCLGNITLSDSISFYYDVTFPELEEVIILSNDEIGLKFHESLNRSNAENENNYFIDKGFDYPSRAILQDSALNRVHLTFDAPFSVPNQYGLSIKSLTDTLNNVIDSINIAFEFEDQVDTVYIVAANLINVQLSEPPLAPVNLTSFLISKDIGLPTIVEIDADNPRLLRLGFDQNLKANTVYELYIKDLISTETLERLVTPSKALVYDTRAPRVAELIVQNDTQLIIKWDEPIDLKSAFSVVNYKLNGVELPVDIAVVDPFQIKLTFESSIPPEEVQVLKVSGIADLAGNETGTISRNFIYDPIPPGIIGVGMNDENSLTIHISERLDTASVYMPDHYSLNDQYPTAISLTGPDSLQIQLAFLEIPESEQQLISIKGLMDKYENPMDSIGFYFNSLNPTVSKLEFLSDSVLEIFFSKEMASSDADKTNYLINGMPVQGLESESPRSVHLGTAKKLLDFDSVAITFLSLTDLNGNAMLEDSAGVVFNSFFENWRLIDPKTLEISFSTEFKMISKEQFSLSNNLPVLVQPDGDDKSIIRLVFEDSLAHDQPMNLNWIGLNDRYGRRIPDHNLRILIDKSPPQLLSIESDYANTIHLLFNESLAEESIFKNQFSMIGDVELVEVHQLSDSSVSLQFDQLEDLQAYQIILKGVSDVQGNSMVEDTISFTYETPYLPKQGEIIITELMVDPSLGVGLPESEYLELYNNTDQIIRLSSMIFSDATKQVNLPEFDFLPGSYLVLSGDPTLGNSLYVPGFPTMDNSADSLALLNLNGEVIDLVVYTRDWYGDTEKDDGGYSLELINPESICPGIVNWGASISASGGTPGEQNSIYNLSPDVESPTFVNYHLEGETIQITFSELVDSLSIQQDDFSITGLTIEELLVKDRFVDQVVISFTDMLQAGILYELSVNGMQDCSGNELIPFSISFGHGASPKFNDVIITEIMVDPEPVLGLPNSEYIEIYNRTDQLISLADVKLRDGGGEVTLPSVTLSAYQFALLIPTNAVDQFNTVDHVFGVSGWRSLNNEGEPLAIFYQDELVFNLEYSTDWHSIANEGGISLEMKDTNNPCAGAINWGSSTSSNGGTPGGINSIAESVPDNFGPELINVLVQSDTTLRLEFDEQLLFEEITPEQFEILPGPVKVSGIVLDTLKRDFLMVHLSEKLVHNTNYTITLNRISDCLGNLISANTKDFLLPEQADSLDVIINEVLFNPRKGGVDFVELYNRSNKNIDLKDWRLGRQYDDVIASYFVTDNSHVLRPMEYIVLTVAPGSIINNYPNVDEKKILQMESMTPYPNETAKIVLQNDENQMIDAFEYHEDMHLSFLKSEDGVSLERISFDSPTQDPNNWQSASSTVGFATPGYQNSQFIVPSISGTLSIEPKVFVPANHASTFTQDFTTINYQLNTTGQLANVNIYNRNGQLIKNIGTGISLASNGFLRWDGTTDQGAIASMGYYLVVFETYDIKGNRNVLKETVVVGR